MNLQELLHRIRHKLTKLRLQQIRVFCLHHVCAEFDEESMNACDWVQIDEFKSNVEAMQKDGVEFVTLTEAYRHISHDWIRSKKYAVLTFDDGYASLKEILPWLEEQLIPATLFINGKYLDGKSYRKNPKEQYLTKEELFALSSPLVEIGLHGWEHTDASQMTQAEFEESINRSVDLLNTHPRYIPFHAYTWGRHTPLTDRYLRDQQIIPVLVGGKKNYCDTKYIDREIL